MRTKSRQEQLHYKNIKRAKFLGVLFVFMLQSSSVIFYSGRKREVCMKKIMIMGSAGSGKSTLAKTLSNITGIEAIHLDREFWKPGWVMTEKPEQVIKHKTFMKNDSWIIDGNYNESLQERVEHADLIIFLDMPFYLCFYRIISRSYKYRGKTRSDMAVGCEEKIDKEFLLYVINYHRKKKYDDLKKLFRFADHSKIHTLKSVKEIDQFLEKWQGM